MRPLEDRGLLSLITPAQMRHAYGVNAITFSANGQTIQGDGSGQTIAIVVADHNDFLWDELYLFDGPTMVCPTPTSPSSTSREIRPTTAGRKKKRLTSSGPM